MSLQVINRLKCFVCGNVASSSQRLFKVPTSQERVKKWLQIFNREDLLDRDPAYLQKNAKVCSNHFFEWAYTGTDRKRLIAFAMPETAEPPSAPLPQILQSAAVLPSVSSRLQVPAPSGTSLLQVTEPSNELRLQAAATLSSISSGAQVVATKFAAPSISSQTQVVVLSASPRSQVAVPPARPLVTVPSAKLQAAVPSARRQFAATSTFSIRAQDVPVNSYVPYKRTREQQIILNQRSTISRLRKKIEKLKVSFDEELKKKLSPEMYSFVKSQIRQHGRRSIKGRRWEKEDKTFALAVYKKSPSVYKLLREKLALPSKTTLRRCS